MSDLQFFDLLIAGKITTDFIIDLKNRSHENILGGSALYAAGGARCWNERIAVVSHTHEKQSASLKHLQDRYKIDFSGVKLYSDLPDDRRFFGYVTPGEFIADNPVAFYASRRLPLPKGLIGFSQSEPEEDETIKIKHLPEDIPSYYWDITAALLCAAGLRTQMQFGSMLLNSSVKTLVVQSSPLYMKLTNFELLPVLMKDLNTFITTISQLKNLFRHRMHEKWEMSEYLCSIGCEHVVVFDEAYGFYLYDRVTGRRHQVPIYPVDLADPTGILDAFCGGYLAGIKKNFDPLEALLHGTVSASFTGEGVGPFYGADSIHELHNSRLKFAWQLVKQG